MTLGEAEVGNGRSLEGVKDFVAANAARAIFLKEFDGFRCGHGRKIAIESPGEEVKDASSACFKFSSICFYRFLG